MDGKVDAASVRRSLRRLPSRSAAPCSPAYRRARCARWRGCARARWSAPQGVRARSAACLIWPISEIFAIDEISAIAKQAAATRYAGHAGVCFTDGIFPRTLRGPSNAGVVPLRHGSVGAVARADRGLSRLRRRPRTEALRRVRALVSRRGTGRPRGALRLNLAGAASSASTHCCCASASPIRQRFASRLRESSRDGERRRLGRRRGRRRRRARRSGAAVVEPAAVAGYLDEVAATLDRARSGDARRRSNERVTALGGRACGSGGAAAPRASTRADRKPVMPAARLERSPLRSRLASMPARASKSTSAGARWESVGCARRRRAMRRYP